MYILSKYACARVVSTYSMKGCGQMLACAIVHVTAHCLAQKGAYLVKDMKLNVNIVI